MAVAVQLAVTLDAIWVSDVARRALLAVAAAVAGPAPALACGPRAIHGGAGSMTVAEALGATLHAMRITHIVGCTRATVTAGKSEATRALTFLASAVISNGVCMTLAMLRNTARRAIWVSDVAGRTL